jgi:hypothetical protein
VIRGGAHQSRIGPVLVLALAALVGISGVVGYLVGIGQRPSAPAWSGDPVLDGAAPIDVDALATVAIDRAALGAEWLAGVTRADGSFYYEYDPDDDEYEDDEYNEVRHAGTAYALFTAYGAREDPDVLEAAEGAARYIEESSHAASGHPGRAYLYQGRLKLGGQALALVALLERRRVLGDTAHDDLIGDLAEFMTAMELPDAPGRYYQFYEMETDELLLEPASNFYPGEALLALTRLAQQFPDGAYLEAATRAAAYLIYEKDGDIPAAGQIPREDHWLTIALGELYRLDPRPEYRQVAYMQADSMVANQHTDDDLPMRIGAPARQRPINYTSVATKGEALVAAWALAVHAGDGDRAARYATATRRNLQFQLRVQFTEENTQLFSEPEAAIGGWGRNDLDSTIRIDFVQHNVSSLLGMWSLTMTGDIPVAQPFP